MTPPILTTKQHEIIQLLYHYRFLNRTQIQQFLGHKDKRRVISWLKDLRDKQFIDWHYNPTDFIAKSQPAVYFLAVDGIRLLRSDGRYPEAELRKRYRDKDRTPGYMDQCQLIGDCCLALQAKTSGDLRYGWLLPADITGLEDEPNSLAEIKPNLFFTKHQTGESFNYMLEVIEATMPRYQLRKRLKEYIDFLAYDWDDDQGSSPIALFVCPDIATLIYIKRRLRQTMPEENGDNPNMRVTTRDKLETKSLTGMIWEEL